jgi:biopolymer transport protein ExbD
MERKGLRRRLQNSGASGFADIAFMLLFFFLVTTQIQEEKGITSQLPPPDAIQGPSPRTMTYIRINAADQILIDSELINPSQLQTKLYRVMREEGYQNVSFVLKNSTGTSYSAYLNIYSSLKGAYKRVRNDYAKQHYNKAYHDTPMHIRKTIEREIPIRIAEASM